MSVIKLVYSNSTVGRFHRDKGIPNQDVIKFVESEDLTVAVLADGVSSAENGGDGAKTAVKTVAEFLMRNGNRFMLLEVDTAKTIIINEVLMALKQKAGDRDIEEFASTLCFALFQKSSKKVMLFSLGDSNIYLFSEKACELFYSNNRGDTRFTVSEDAESFANLTTFSAENCFGVMLCSDGAWRSMYQNGSMLPFLVKSSKTADFDVFCQHFENQNCDDDSSVLMMSF